MKPPKMFENNPIEVKEQVEEAIKVEERKEKRREKLVKPEPPKPMEWWVHQVLFWGMMVYIVIISITPVFRAIKYTATANKEIEFVKENTDMVKALREYREGQIKQIDDRIVGAFK